MKVGDLVICNPMMTSLTGLILDLDFEELKLQGIVWAKILWDDGRITWEDINPEGDKLFEVVSESR